MRSLLTIVLVLSLTLSGVVNAAMLCCLDTETGSVAEQSDTMPCHQSAEEAPGSTELAGSMDCQCDCCIHFVALELTVAHEHPYATPIHWSDDETMHSLDTEHSHYPPRPVS